MVKLFCKSETVSVSRYLPRGFSQSFTQFSQLLTRISQKKTFLRCNNLSTLNYSYGILRLNHSMQLLDGPDQ